MALPAGRFSTAASGMAWAAGLGALPGGRRGGAWRKPVARLAALYGSQFRLQGLDSLGAGLGILGVAVVLGWVGSWIAARGISGQIEPVISLCFQYDICRHDELYVLALSR